MSKEITIRSWHHGRSHDWTGTMDHLIKDVFGYTIECGCSWNHKLNPHPKTGRALATLLNKCAAETQRSCYERDSYELVK